MIQEALKIYQDHHSEIENFLKESINNLGDIERHDEKNFKRIFDAFPSLELAYVCDKNSFDQMSPNVYRGRRSDIAIGRNRTYLVEKVDLQSANVLTTKPYVSSATGNSCITLIKQEGERIYFFDFHLKSLLQRMGFIERDARFNFLSKSFYALTSGAMILLALFAVGYALVSFYGALFVAGEFSIDAIFKPVIALTLGLAIFDLAKTIMEQEVLFKSYAKSAQNEYRVLTKFLVTIIIALLIESLMVVFKIAMEDYAKMIHATYLILGVGALITTLALFIYLTGKRGVVKK